MPGGAAELHCWKIHQNSVTTGRAGRGQTLLTEYQSLILLLLTVTVVHDKCMVCLLFVHTALQ
jgi:hypothetical protein